MRYSLFYLLIATLYSAAATADYKKPNGEELFDILFSSLSLPLSNEPLCDMTYFSRKNTPITLGHHLATVLSSSFESKNSVTVKTECTRSKHDLENKKIIEVWDCNINVLELNAKKKFISSSITAFAITLDKTKIVPGSLRCT